ncbi:hypothetical protein [Galactobacter valiniphilus]|uniref:hypothetical protein n=1 Tax=Galactobacter valiniphilus TaxID=2676122 RepID=UPI003734EDAE
MMPTLRARTALTLALVLPAALALSACDASAGREQPAPTSTPAPPTADPSATAPSTGAPIAEPSAPGDVALTGWTWSDGSPVLASEGPVPTPSAPTMAHDRLPRSKADPFLWGTVTFTSEGKPLDVLTSLGTAVLTPTTSIVTVIDGKLASPFAAGHDPFEGNAETQAKYPNFTVGDPLPTAMKGRSWPVEVAPDQAGGFVFAASDAPVDSAQGGTPGGTVTLYAVDRIGGEPRKLAVASDDNRGAYYLGHLRVGDDAAGRPAVYWTAGVGSGTTNEWSLPLTGGTARETLKNGLGLGYVNGEPYAFARRDDGGEALAGFGPVRDGKVSPLVRFGDEAYTVYTLSTFTAKGAEVTFPGTGVRLNIGTRAVTVNSKIFFDQ